MDETNTHKTTEDRPGMTRREALRASAGMVGGIAVVGVGAGTAAGQSVSANPPVLSPTGAGSHVKQPTAAPAPKRVLRIAHLTDVHVQSERQAAVGFATAMRHVQELADTPQLVLFGGDNLMNVDSADGAARADQQLATWRKALKDELSLPFRTCVGNHDILKLQQVEGKKWAVDALEIPARYYTFDQAGWRFVVLEGADKAAFADRLEALAKARQDSQDVAKLAKLRLPPLCVAVIAPRIEVFGMARMWQALADPVGWPTGVFREAQEARNWLDSTMRGVASGA